MNTPLHENFCERKAINAILYIANNVERKDFHQIFKILYFSDRMHISLYGRSISGDNYIAMPEGPVPSIIYDICKDVKEKRTEKYNDFFIVKDKYKIIPTADPNLRSLSKTDIKCIEESIEKYGKLSKAELIAVSHDFAWNNTKSNTQISLENIILEAGNDEDYIDFLKENFLSSHTSSLKCHCQTI